MKMPTYKFIAAMVTAAILPQLAPAQSVLSTILGSAPDGVSASTATLSEPCAVAADKNGNVYVALKAVHQIVRIDKTGTVFLVAGNGLQGYSGDGGPAKSAQLSTPAALAVDSGGNLYIADSDYSVIRRVSTAGVITTFAGTGKGGNTGNGGPASAATLKSPSALAFAPNGNLLIADTGNHQIRQITAAGVISLVAGTGVAGGAGNNGPAISAQLNSPAGVAVDGAGNIYIADTKNAWVRKVNTSGTISMYAGYDKSTASSPSTTSLTITIGLSNPNSQGWGAAFASTTYGATAINYVLTLPTSIAVDQAGNLFIIQYGIGRILQVTTGGLIGSYVGTGSNGTAGDGGWARMAQINAVGINTDSQNNLLIADGVTNRVRAVALSTGIIDSIGGTGLSAYNPKSFALSGNNLYFSDTAAHRVRKLDLTTGAVSLVAGNGSAGYSGDGGSALQAQLNSPRGLALDSGGNLYIADSANNLVRKVNTSGVISTAVGTGFAGSGGDGLLATAANVNQPAAVVFDGSGNLYIAEQSGQFVRKMTPGGVMSTVAGTGSAGAPSSESGPALSTTLSFPQGLALDAGGGILIADTGNNRIRRLASGGTLTTVAGSSSPGYSGDGGPATAAQLRSPYGVAVDSTGNMYIADTTNAVIRRVDSKGIITTAAGIGYTPGFNGEGGSPATAFKLNTPYAVAVVSPTNILIADTGNQRIRKLQPSTTLTVTSVPSGLLAAVDGRVGITPFSIELRGGVAHTLAAPSPQAGPNGVRFVAPAEQVFDVDPALATATVSLNFAAQFALTVIADDGGAVTPAAAWQDAGAVVTLQAAAASGYDFAGWEGDCQGPGMCQLSMTGPRGVKAAFMPSDIQKAAVAGVIGAGMSAPPVTRLSPGGLAAVLGSGFAPVGSNASVDAAGQLGGMLPTRLNGVCVLLGGTPAPLLALTPSQITFQVPHVAAPSALTVQVLTGCGSVREMRSDLVTASLDSASPEFFYYSTRARGRNPVSAVNAATGGIIGPPGLISGASAGPARPGDAVTLYATGLGATSPWPAAGIAPDSESPITGDFWISVGDLRLDSANIRYVGVSKGRPGVYEIRIQLPDSVPDGDQPVRISVDNFASPGSAYIAVQR